MADTPTATLTSGNGVRRSASRRNDPTATFIYSGIRAGAIFGLLAYLLNALTLWLAADQSGEDWLHGVLSDQWQAAGLGLSVFGAVGTIISLRLALMNKR